MSEAIAKLETPSVGLQWRQATDVAGAVREFAIKRVLNIQGKRYPPVEVWQAVANAFGCVASSKDVEKVDGGFRAVGEVRRLSDGMVIASGVGFVGDDEKMWASRPVFARMAMAQTRSIGRACRAAFAFVIPLIDSGLMTTPAEEMDFLDAEPQRPAPQNKVVEIKRNEPPPPSDNDAPPPDEQAEIFADEQSQAPELTWPWGKEKGKVLSRVNTKSLQWATENLPKNIEDPAKQRFRGENEKLLSAVKAELARR